MKSITFSRPVRSYVVRAGRVTPAQRRALEVLWPRYGLSGEGLLDLDQIFGRRVPRILEIGFGSGDALLELAECHRDSDFLGVEVHPPGIGRLLAGLEALALDNVRVLRMDAIEALQERMPDACLDGVNIWFPDPWPKKRHRKRRLVQPEFVGLLARKLKLGARVHLATDWEDYARQMLEVMEARPEFRNLAAPGCYYSGDTGRPATRFQRRGERLGHGVWDLLYRRATQTADVGGP